MTAKQNSSEIVMLITTHAKWHAELSNFSSMLRKVPLKSKKQSRKFYTLVLISRKKKKTTPNNKYRQTKLQDNGEAKFPMCS